MAATAHATPIEETLEAGTARVRELNERLLAEAKKAGNVTLDAYEATLHTIADYTAKVGAASPIEGVAAVATAQADLMRELTDAYTKSARTLLK
jgi:hypothetical protein